MEEIAYVAVNRRLRPLRFGFLVRANDSDSLLKSIELNTRMETSQTLLLKPLLPALLFDSAEFCLLLV